MEEYARYVEVLSRKVTTKKMLLAIRKRPLSRLWDTMRKTVRMHVEGKRCRQITSEKPTWEVEKMDSGTSTTKHRDVVKSRNFTQKGEEKKTYISEEPWSTFSSKDITQTDACACTCTHTNSGANGCKLYMFGAILL